MWKSGTYEIPGEEAINTLVPPSIALLEQKSLVYWLCGYRRCRRAEIFTRCGHSCCRDVSSDIGLIGPASFPVIP